MAHVDPRRTLPDLASTPFRRAWDGSIGRGRGRRGERSSRRVLLLDDTFHNFFEPGPLAAAARVLERAGYRVELPPRQVCCGRPLISKGLLEDVREVHRDLLDVLSPAIAEGIPVIGLEPSCILTFRDELPDLTRDSRAPLLARNSFMLEEFLAGDPDFRPGRLERRAVVHGHCHQKAIIGMEPTRQLLRRVEGLEFSILDSGCCGMAGSFGYEKGHYEISRAAGERVLFPAVRAATDDLVVAPGFSCRSQIKDFCAGRRALHTAELLALAQ
jgi:Fe-S oxidoreductase